MKTLIAFVSCRKGKGSVAALVWCGVVMGLIPACATRSQFQMGYERGAADTVKRQYWILQDMQRRDESGRDRPHLTVYRLPVTPDPNSKVKTVPYDISIPIYE